MVRTSTSALYSISIYREHIIFEGKMNTMIPDCKVDRYSKVSSRLYESPDQLEDVIPILSRG